MVSTFVPHPPYFNIPFGRSDAIITNKEPIIWKIRALPTCLILLYLIHLILHTQSSRNRALMNSHGIPCLSVVAAISLSRYLWCSTFSQFGLLYVMRRYSLNYSVEFNLVSVLRTSKHEMTNYKSNGIVVWTHSIVYQKFWRWFTGITN